MAGPDVAVPDSGNDAWNGGGDLGTCLASPGVAELDFAERNFGEDGLYGGRDNWSCLAGPGVDVLDTGDDAWYGGGDE